MTMKKLRNVFMWCAIINWCVLLIWFLFTVLGPGWRYQWASHWKHLSPNEIDLINFGAMALYKVGILLFNLVPAIALHIVGSRSSKE